MSFGGSSSGGVGGGSRRTMTRIPYYVYYNPLTNVPNCTLWLDSSDINGNGANVSVGSSVGTWIDKSGSGNHFTQATASNQPVYQNDTLFNKNGLSFNGANRYMVQSNTSLYAINSSNYTIFTVHSFYDPSNGPGQNDGTIYRGANVAAAVWFRQQGPNAANFYTDTNYISVYGSPTALSGSSLSGISCVNTTAGSTAEGFINGVSAGTANRGGTTNLALMLGTSPTLSNEYFYGTLFEMMVFNRGLSTNEQQTIESYLTQKYKITTVLPTTHLNVTRPAGTPKFVSAIVVNTMPVPYTVPNSVDSNSISISLTSNLFLVSWPTIGQQGSLLTFYKVDMFRNTVLSTSGGTLLNSQTVSSSVAALAGTYNLSNYYYAGIYSSNTKGLASVVYSPFGQPPPPPPASLTVSITPTLASFTIAASSNATYDTLSLYSNPTNSTTGGTFIESTSSSNLTPVIAGSFSRSLYYYATAVAGDSYGESTPYTSGSKQIPPLAPASLSVSMTTALASYTIAPVTGANTYSVSIYSNSSNATTGGSLVNTVSGASTSLTSSGSYSAALYYYAVGYAINLGGNSSTVSSTTAQPPPAAPATFTFTINSSNAAFTIASSATATSYNVLLYSNATNSTTGGTVVGSNTASSTTPSISGSYSATAYYYATVSASSANGTSGLKTSVVTQTPPTSPATLGFTLTSTLASFTIAPVTAVSAYYVTVFSNATSATTGGTSVYTSSNATTSRTISGSFSAANYYYATVYSVNLGGNSSAAPTTSSSILLAPSAPATLGIVLTATLATFTIASTAGASGYALTFYSNTTNSTTGGTSIGTYSGAGLTPTFSGSYSASTYYYGTVAASNTVGSSALTVSAISTAPPPTPASVTFVNLGITVGNFTVASVAGAVSYTVNVYSSATRTNTGGTFLTSGTSATTSVQVNTWNSGFGPPIMFTDAYYYVTATCTNAGGGTSGAVTSSQICTMLSYTGADQTWTSPYSGTVTITLCGGGSSTDGGLLVCTASISNGTNYTVSVGGGGSIYGTGAWGGASGAGTGGNAGGGGYFAPPAGGGGMTQFGTIMYCGGAGGAGTTVSCQSQPGHGGFGGGTTGQDGTSGSVGGGGTGGTQSAAGSGGAGGGGASSGSAGSGKNGGNGGQTGRSGGGGGGGGYYGGGGGGAANGGDASGSGGGGGGSSYYTGCTLVLNTQGGANNNYGDYRGGMDALNGSCAIVW